ncbi:MAG: DUF1501 domain-containing protein [Acidobacteria bacterium]|nr:DUF1501 domain-containing protein [Acidobacteriota bacterium]
MQSTRRNFLAQAAIQSLMAGDTAPHFAPKAKRIIYLFMFGGPSQIETFDYKPRLKDLHGQELPGSIRMGQRLTAMTATQTSFPVARSIYSFAQYGQSGMWVSELLPHTAKIVDKLAFIRSMNTEQINHDPGITFFQTGFQLAGRPSLGSWLSYGLGSENKDLPSYVVMTAAGQKLGDQPLADRVWGSGFLPSSYQGVRFRSGADPVLHLSNPVGMDRDLRRKFLDGLAEMNREQLDVTGDPEVATRISQYEMAFRMQTSVPELTDLSKEPAHVVDRYGPDARKPGSFAANCLLARKLSERGVRTVQLFHRGWDHHRNLQDALPAQCRAVDQASAALVADLADRGLLDETLVVWGGEFGRTVYCQGPLTPAEYGRDHHPRCFTIWMAGGGVKAGAIHGATDDFSYNITEDPVSVHDLHATILHCLGVDHTKLTFKFQGRHYRLTDVHGNVVKKVLT